MKPGIFRRSETFIGPRILSPSLQRTIFINPFIWFLRKPRLPDLCYSHITELKHLSYMSKKNEYNGFKAFKAFEEVFYDQKAATIADFGRGFLHGPFKRPGL